MRDRIMAGFPFAERDRADILDYCQSDVDAMGPLLERMLPGIRAGRAGLGQALLRGRYSVAVAHMEHTGVPIDTETLGVLLTQWEPLKASLIEAVDVDYGVYDGTSFRAGRFGAYLDSRGIAWPRLPSGALALDSRTFRDMAKVHPEVER